MDALHEDFAEHGAAAIAQARQESPMGYVRMIAALLPHKHEVRQGDDVSSMTDAELEAVIRHLDVLTAAHEELDDAPLPLHLAHGA